MFYEWLVNLSDSVFNKKEGTLLTCGLKYAVPSPKHLEDKLRTRIIAEIVAKLNDTNDIRSIPLLRSTLNENLTIPRIKEEDRITTTSSRNKDC